MIYVLSWRGKGYVALLALIAAVLVGVGAGAVSDHLLLMGMSLGLLSAASVCWILGRRWNRADVRHIFCGMRLPRWAIVFGFFGLLLLPTAIHAAQYRL
jgi:hypothetical protein